MCVGCEHKVAVLFSQKLQLCDQYYKHQEYIRRIKEICVFCGQKQIVETRTDAGPVCSSCHAKTKPRQECQMCHRLSSFDLTDASQISLAFAPENHQWLQAKDNLKKGATYAKM